MRARRLRAPLLLGVLLAAALPGAAAAHADLVSSDPAAGTTLTASPASITADFSEPVDPGRSTMELRGPDGSTIATGRVPDGGPATRMAIASVAVLPAGSYEIRWTTVTADDGGVERGTYSFAVASAGSSAGPGASAGVAPSASPTPATTPPPATGAGVGDLLLPIVVLAAVLVGGAAVLLRRRR